LPRHGAAAEGVKSAAVAMADGSQMEEQDQLSLGRDGFAIPGGSLSAEFVADAIAEARSRGPFLPMTEDPGVFCNIEDGVGGGGALFNRAALKPVGPQTAKRLCGILQHLGPARVNIGSKEFPCVRTMNRFAGHGMIPADADKHAAALAAGEAEGPMRMLVQVRAGTAQAGVCFSLYAEPPPPPREPRSASTTRART
jgi:hypothetical protein